MTLVSMEPGRHRGHDFEPLEGLLRHLAEIATDHDAACSGRERSIAAELEDFLLPTRMILGLAHGDAVVDVGGRMVEVAGDDVADHGGALHYHRLLMKLAMAYRERAEPAEIRAPRPCGGVAALPRDKSTLWAACPSCGLRVAD